MLRLLGLIVVLPLVAILLPFILLWTIWESIRIDGLRREFKKKHGDHARGILIYSNSPNWKAYIEQQWIPRLAGTLVILNWSERNTWGPELAVETALFRSIGDREFNPAAIVFRDRATGSALGDWLRALRRLDIAGVLLPHRSSMDVIRFFKAFRDYKHGKTLTLAAAEERLFSSLGLDRPDGNA
jgi:hypothetical protein